MSEATIRLRLPQSLRALVSGKFIEAQTSHNLVFSETQLTVLRNSARIPFQVRYCPALSRKPVTNKQPPAKSKPADPEVESSQRKFDPFESPSESLLIARIPSQHDYTHNLVLNKFPVIPNHFILATRENKPQTGLLEHSDLHLTHTCVCAWNDDSQHSLYAFFNSGEHSGASQPHRHLQFLPVEDMKGPSAQSEWEVLFTCKPVGVSEDHPLFYDPSFPVVHFSTRIDPSMKPSELHDRYLVLLRATALWLEAPQKSADDIIRCPSLPPLSIALENGQPKFSYNLAITQKVMTILPRRNGDATIPSLSKKADNNSTVSINGTILAGTLMVKNEDEWEALRTDPTILDDLLEQIAFPVARAKI